MHLVVGSKHYEEVPSLRDVSGRSNFSSKSSDIFCQCFKQHVPKVRALEFQEIISGAIPAKLLLQILADNTLSRTKYRKVFLELTDIKYRQHTKHI